MVNGVVETNQTAQAKAQTKKTSSQVTDGFEALLAAFLNQNMNTPKDNALNNLQQGGAQVDAVDNVLLQDAGNMAVENFISSFEYLSGAADIGSMQAAFDLNKETVSIDSSLQQIVISGDSSPKLSVKEDLENSLQQTNVKENLEDSLHQSNIKEMAGDGSLKLSIKENVSSPAEMGINLNEESTGDGSLKFSIKENPESLTQMGINIKEDEEAGSEIKQVSAETLDKAETMDLEKSPELDRAGTGNSLPINSIIHGKIENSAKENLSRADMSFKESLQQTDNLPKEDTKETFASPVEMRKVLMKFTEKKDTKTGALNEEPNKNQLTQAAGGEDEAKNIKDAEEFPSVDLSKADSMGQADSLKADEDAETKNSDENLAPKPALDKKTSKAQTAEEHTYIEKESLDSEKEGSIKDQEAHNQRFDVLLNKTLDISKNIDLKDQSTTQDLKHIVSSNKDDIMNQIYDSIKTSKMDDTTELHISLKPQELGEVVVKLVMEKGVMTGKITVQDNFVKDLIESNLQVVKDNLKEQNLNMADIGVFIGAGSQNPYHGQSPNRDKWTPVKLGYSSSANSIGAVENINYGESTDIMQGLNLLI